MQKVFILALLTLAACASGEPYSDQSLIGTSRPPKKYPQEGYVLDNNGTYSFEARAMTRN